MAQPRVFVAVSAIIAAGLLAVVCLSFHARQDAPVTLVGDPWMTDYLLASPDDYNMNQDIEGLSNTFPFRDPMTSGPEVLKAAKAKQSQLSLRKQGPVLTFKGYPQQIVVPVQQLCGAGAACEYENENNVAAAKNLDEATVVANMPPPPSEDVVKEVQEAISAYDSEMNFQKKLNEGDPENNFKVKHARTQVLCGLDAGCEDDMRAALETAAKVDGETVSADMPEYPDADTIDDVYRAIEDRRVMNKEEDKRRRGKPPVVQDDRD